MKSGQLKELLICSKPKDSEKIAYAKSLSAKTAFSIDQVIPLLHLIEGVLDVAAIANRLPADIIRIDINEKTHED